MHVYFSGIAYWCTFGNTSHLAFVFTLRPTARLNLISCSFYANIPSPRSYCKRRMQFQMNYLAPFKSTWSQLYKALQVDHRHMMRTTGRSGGSARLTQWFDYHLEGRRAVNYIFGRHPSTTVSGYPIKRKVFLLFSWSTKIWDNRLTDLVQGLGVRHIPVINT